MKIKPILFSTPMVQAIQEGRKTQTRRNIKPQPDVRGLRTTNVEFEDWHGLEVKPKYQKGDILWVRETFRYAHHYGIDYEFVQYKDGSTNTHCEIPDKDQILHDDKWKPSIFMPKAACRIFLEISDVRVERLHDISEDAAIAEGVIYDEGFKSYNCYLCDKKGHKAGENLCEDGFFDNAFESFRSLWQSINGEVSWKANPAVFVYEFKRVKKPENFLV